MRRILWYATLGLILAAVLATGAFAGSLTAGNYTYVLAGRELDLPVDILTVRGAVLAPEALLRAVGLTPEVKGDQLLLRRGPVRVEMQLGSDVAQVDGQQKLFRNGPLRIGNRLFVPVDALDALGLTVEMEGKFVLVGDNAPDAGAAPATPEVDLDRAMANATMQGILRGNTGAYGEVTISALSPDLLRADRLQMPWATRMRLLQMIRTRSLLMVTVKNTSFRTLSLDPAKLLVTDAQGRQYDYLKTEVALDGQVTTLVAPGAIRTSVLAYERSAGPLTLYYEPNLDVLGKVFQP